MALETRYSLKAKGRLAAIPRAIPPKTHIRVLLYRREFAHRGIVNRIEMVGAAQLGVSAAVVSDPTRAMDFPSALFLLQVQDTLTALHNLTTHYRRLIPPLRHALP